MVQIRSMYLSSDREVCKRLVEKADFIIMLDFNQPDRLGEMENLVTGSKAMKDRDRSSPRSERLY